MHEDHATTQIERAAEAFYLDRQAEGCTVSTLLWYRRYLGAGVGWLLDHGIDTAGSITAGLLRAYIVDVQGRGLSPKTVHHYASALRTFCNWAAAEGLLPTGDNPAKRVRMPKVPKDVLPALTAADVGQLLDACECSRDKALLLFMLDTGCRAAETVALDVGDMDTATGAVTVRRGKGQKGRVVFLGAQARRTLMRYLLDREELAPVLPLWVSLTTGERLTTWGVNQLLQRMGERAGVHVHPHKLRRTCAIWSLRAGMDLARLGLLLGHADLQTVRRYLAIVEGDLSEAHKEHGAVDSMLRGKKGGRA